MPSIIDDYFGSLRGAIRLGLSYAEVAGRAASVSAPAPQTVRRLVFVCHGNICRSAFAEAVAKQLGFETASFGLSTTTGKPAHPPVAAISAERGFALEHHRTTDIIDYVPRQGDYLLAMEVRHLRKLAADERLCGLPRGLLGAYATWPIPHIHDPYMLSDRYFRVCLSRIENAVAGLCASFPSARPF